MEISLTATVFIHPWHGPMPNIYVVQLRVPAADEVALWRVLERLGARNALWEQAFQAAQSELGWGVATREGETTAQFLLDQTHYEHFKADLRAAKETS